MIKEYSIDGNQFKTVMIPRGTLLFRGIDFQTKTHYTKLFHDFIGYIANNLIRMYKNMIKKHKNIERANPRPFA